VQQLKIAASAAFCLIASPLGNGEPQASQSLNYNSRVSGFLFDGISPGERRAAGEPILTTGSSRAYPFQVKIARSIDFV